MIRERLNERRDSVSHPVKPYGGQSRPVAENKVFNFIVKDLMLPSWNVSQYLNGQKTYYKNTRTCNCIVGTRLFSNSYQINGVLQAGQ